MQYQDNDMDELFEKAGRSYPLKTDNSGWDVVFGKLQQPDTRATAPKRKPFDKRYYWLLLLLLPVGYLNIDGLIGANDEKSQNRNSVFQKYESPEHVDKPQHKENDEEINQIQNNREKIPTMRQSDSSRKQEPDKNIRGLHRAARIARQSVAKEGFIRQNVAKEGFARQSLPKEGFTRQNIAKEGFALRSVARAGRGWTVSPSGETEVAKGDESEFSFSNELNSTQSFDNIPVNHSYKKPSININITSSTIDITSSTIDITSSTINIPSSTAPTPSQPKLKSVPKFYTGFIAGPDLSTIKYQQINNIGYSVGMLVGYNISKKFSIETGVLYSKKKYYTEGKYFDQVKAGIPSSVYVHDLNGGCNMFEIPVAVKYNFSTRDNTLFATAGIISYFMKTENYDYKAYAGGTYYDGYKSYKNSGNHLLANMQLSVGYEYQLSKNLSLRTEPYIKIPLNKIGIGNMPITSAGIYFGVMKKIR